MNFKRIVTITVIAMLMGGCAVLTSNPYYKPTISGPTQGRTDGGGFAYIRFGGQNMLTTTESEVKVGVKSIGSMHGYVPMAMGPILPIIPTFLTAPNEAHPLVHLEIYLSSSNNDFTFDPMIIRIKNSKGVEYIPVSYVGPVNAATGAFPFYRGEQVTSASRAIALSKNGSYCFVLEFDMKSSPDWNIQMQFNGLRTSGHTMPAPEFQFERGTAVYIMWGGRELFCSG